MFSLRLTLITLFALPFAACDDSSDGDGPTQLGGADVVERHVQDSGTSPDPDDGVEPSADTGMEADEGPEADGTVEPDSSSTIRDIQDCEDACEVYDTCGRTAELWNGERAQCLAACADAEASPRFMGYISCLQITRCEELERCAVPERPAPNCEQVCGALRDCFTDEIPNLDQCEVECSSPGNRIQGCGQALAEAAEPVCEAEPFLRCMLEGDACLAECDKRAPCEEIDVFECVAECQAVPPAEDPVAARRAVQHRGCILGAPDEDCEALAACDQPIGGADADPEAIAAVCAADAECGFMGEDCEDHVGEVLLGLDGGGAECLSGALAECAAPLDCVSPAPAPEGFCDEYCLIGDLCDTLPEGQTEFDCAEACRGALAGDDADLQAPWRARFGCANAGTCEAFTACQEATADANACALYCGLRGECELEAAEDCDARCAEAPRTDRFISERNCTGIAGACVGAELCVAPEPPPCAELCEPLAACELGGEDCVGDCDNTDFADPTAFLPTLACVLSTERCDRRAECDEGDLAGGAACMAWCELQVGCAEEPEQSMIECIRGCAAGFEGRAGLDFEAARACLVEAEGCDALQACVDDVEADSYCAPHCAEVARCLLAEDAEACAAECSDAAEAEETIDAASCVLGAARRAAGCGVVADCLGLELPPASPACAELCAAQNACDEDLDAFLCERECIPEPEGTPLRAACAGLAECEDLNICLDADPQEPAECAAVCVTIGRCEGLVGEEEGALFADDAACLAFCGGAAVLGGDGHGARVQACVSEAACDADTIDECFRTPANGCDAGYDVIDACGQAALAGPRADWVAACDAEHAADRAAGEARLACLDDVAMAMAANPLACILDVILCLL